VKFFYGLEAIILNGSDLNVKQAFATTLLNELVKDPLLGSSFRNNMALTSARRTTMAEPCIDWIYHVSLLKTAKSQTSFGEKINCQMDNTASHGSNSLNGHDIARDYMYDNVCSLKVSSRRTSRELHQPDSNSRQSTISVYRQKPFWGLICKVLKLKIS
jgi:hypothetical protein